MHIIISYRSYWKSKNTYFIGSTASIICFSNLTVVSIQWLTISDNVSYSTEQLKDNELHLILSDPISEYSHGTMFTCEVTSQLSHGRIATSTTSFTIRTFEESKLNECMRELNYLFIFTESGPVSELVVSHINVTSIQVSWMPPKTPNGVITAYYLRLINISTSKLIINKNLTTRNQHTYYLSELRKYLIPILGFILNILRRCRSSV